MLQNKSALKQVLQIDEIAFRKAGNHGDELISILKGREGDIKDGVLSIRTNLVFNHPSHVIQTFNAYLRSLRRDGIVMINIILD